MKTTKGKFSVTGYGFLPDDVKKMVWKELKAGDPLELVPDPINSIDQHAIKVLFKGIQIGWYSAKGYRQNELFETLIKKQEVSASVVSNTRSQTRHGQQQFVDAMFKYEKTDAEKKDAKKDAKPIDFELVKQLETALVKLSKLKK